MSPLQNRSEFNYRWLRSLFGLTIYSNPGPPRVKQKALEPRPYRWRVYERRRPGHPRTNQRRRRRVCRGSRRKAAPPLGEVKENGQPPTLLNEKEAHGVKPAAETGHVPCTAPARARSPRRRRQGLARPGQTTFRVSAWLETAEPRPSGLTE